MENPTLNLSVGVISGDPQKWRVLLNQFEEVLKINIFMVDAKGQLLVSLSEASGRGDFGSSFLKSSFGLNLTTGADNHLAGFKNNGQYLQMISPFDFHLFAVAVKGDEDQPLFYLIIGPVILGKPWPDEKYVALGEHLMLANENFLRDIHSVSQMSELAMNSILELLAEVTKDVLAIEFEKQKLQQIQSRDETLRPDIANAVQDLFANIQQDELLVQILDSAIKMAGAKSGSLMILDEESQEFVLRVSRGLENKKNIMMTRLKVGEGIAGIAALNKAPLFISGTEAQGDRKLQGLLKRPDIKSSIVVPLIVKDKVVGVLSLCTKNQQDDVDIENISRDICQLSRFIATALHSF
ncbi:MAG: GAF domain-containing protein [Candidatus Omnitrophica bacterium]|nr:GAF domain-containing protein [Candidatus Omnitrophota bacterium]